MQRIELFKDIVSFQDSAVRDLAWVIASPGLLDASYFQAQASLSGQARVIDDEFCRQFYESQRAWLLQQDKDPQALHAWLTQRASHRLGYYFEALLQYWLQHWVGEGALAAHVPVRRNKQTLGEFDFLFTTPGSRALQHWEVAVKFYLAYQQSDGSVRYFGPQARDRLDLKLARLFEHQTQLATTDDGQKAIAQHITNNAFETIESQILLKGYLFYPAQRDWETAPLTSDGISTAHLRGWWTSVDVLHIPVMSAASRWYQVPRLSWLSPVQLTEVQAQALPNHQSLLEALSITQRKQELDPILLAELTQASDGHWREISRGFVVPEGWPAVKKET